jgi:acyl-coenzyme A thioesterase PaaI-like protein
MKLEDDKMCFVCGSENTQGFRLKFDHPEKGLLRSTVVFRKEHQGYKNIAHGGLVAAVLDEMMVNLAWTEGTPAVTAELTVRLKKPTPVGEPIHLEGRIEKRDGRAIYATATATDGSGLLLATASAKCLCLKN